MGVYICGQMYDIIMKPPNVLAEELLQASFFCKIRRCVRFVLKSLAVIGV